MIIENQFVLPELEILNTTKNLGIITRMLAFMVSSTRFHSTPTTQTLPLSLTMEVTCNVESQENPSWAHGEMRDNIVKKTWWEREDWGPQKLYLEHVFQWDWHRWRRNLWVLHVKEFTDGQIGGCRSWFMVEKMIILGLIRLLILLWNGNDKSILEL